MRFMFGFAMASIPHIEIEGLKPFTLRTGYKIVRNRLDSISTVMQTPAHMERIAHDASACFPLLTGFNLDPMDKLATV
jgi:hypothetical protein